MSKLETIKQIFALLKKNKSWWLVPIVTVFVMLGALLVATAGSSLSPFIYALF